MVSGELKSNPPDIRKPHGIWALIRVRVTLTLACGAEDMFTAMLKPAGWRGEDSYEDRVPLTLQSEHWIYSADTTPADAYNSCRLLPLLWVHLQAQCKYAIIIIINWPISDLWLESPSAVCRNCVRKPSNGLSWESPDCTPIVLSHRPQVVL